MTFLNFIRKSGLYILVSLLLLTFLNTCGIYKPVDARKVSPNADERVRKNLEEGRGFTLMGGNKKGGTNYQFASSNPMWRATLEILDFLPLANVDYSGGIITTDWYNEGTASDESIKITIRFLSNEVRSDALDVDIFYKKCIANNNCKISKQEGQLKKEITKQILAKAAVYQKQVKDKNFKPYRVPGVTK